MKNENRGNTYHSTLVVDELISVVTVRLASRLSISVGIVFALAACKVRTPQSEKRLVTVCCYFLQLQIHTRKAGEHYPSRCLVESIFYQKYTTNG